MDRNEREAWLAIADAFRQPRPKEHVESDSRLCTYTGLCHAVRYSARNNNMYLLMLKRLQQTEEGRRCAGGYFWPCWWRKKRADLAARIARTGR